MTSADYYTMKGACKLFGVVRATIIRWMGKDEDPFPEPFKPNGPRSKCLFPRDQVDAWRARRRTRQDT